MLDQFVTLGGHHGVGLIYPHYGSNSGLVTFANEQGVRPTYPLRSCRSGRHVQGTTRRAGAPAGDSNVALISVPSLDRSS